MEFKSEHIIKTQEFQITLADKKDAHVIQDGISALQHTRTSYLLNTILENFTSKNEILQFDAIELNLGTISKANYENELLYRIEEELSSFLNSHILANGTVLSGKKITFIDLKLEQFEYFFVNGYISWNSSSTFKLSSLFEELLLQSEEALKKLLNKHGKNESTRKRLVFQFDDKILSKLITLVAKEESSYILNYRENIIVQQNTQSLIKIESTKFRNSVWDVILTCVFVKPEGNYNRKLFLKYLLEELSKKHGVLYEELLQQLFESFQLNAHLPINSIEFKKIIFELQHDQSSDIALSNQENIGNDKAIAPWIKRVDYYLQTGIFLAPLHSISKQEINVYLFHLLQLKSEMAIKSLNNWLLDSAKKERLLQLSEPSLQEEFKKHISFFFITINNQFVKELELQRAVLSVTSDKLLNNISRIRTKLFLQAFHSDIHAENEVVIYFLRSVLKEFIQKKDILLQLMEEIKDKMPLSFKTPIAHFISEFEQEVEAQFIKAHTLEILNFIKNNSSYLWSDWGARKLEIWSQMLNISEKQLFHKLEQNNPPDNMANYLKHLKIDKDYKKNE